MKRIIFILLFIILFFYLIGCGYRLRGTGTFLPEHIKLIYIKEFKNKTSRFELEKIVTDEVRKEFATRKGFSITAEESSSDAVLFGDILSFAVVPVGVQEVEASRYRIRLTLSVSLYDKKQKKIIYKNSSFFFEEEYDMEGDVDFLSLEDETVKKISQEMAKSLVSTILEGF